MFYIEAWTRIHGKLACTSVKCTWLLPTYVSEVNYAPVQDIDFSSARKLKENLDGKIDTLTPDCKADLIGDQSALFVKDEVEKCRPTTEELSAFYAKLNQCSVKPVALSLQDDYGGQFVVGSRTVAVITDLYETQNLDLNYPDLLRKFLAVKLELTVENIALVEKDALSGEMLEFLSTSGRQNWGLYEWCCLKVQLSKASAVNNKNYRIYSPRSRSRL